MGIHRYGSMSVGASCAECGLVCTSSEDPPVCSDCKEGVVAMDEPVVLVRKRRKRISDRVIETALDSASGHVNNPIWPMLSQCYSDVIILRDRVVEVEAERDELKLKLNAPDNEAPDGITGDDAIAFLDALIDERWRRLNRDMNEAAKRVGELEEELAERPHWCSRCHVCSSTPMCADCQKDTGEADASEAAHRRHQGPRSGMSAIIGRWPGAETDEEVSAALAEIVASVVKGVSQ